MIYLSRPLRIAVMFGGWPSQKAKEMAPWWSNMLSPLEVLAPKLFAFSISGVIAGL